ncbi:hypothetical protein [Agrobacterium tumefaciens]|uniref:hypothetical protein n=1 Tax=Agrobacterium tumefaciens TaxID=358 RepID=UPI00287C6636|nr:hypothetical protein [Agrobacterium tumefaciens]MDS7594915.1 hypothetical protein [Agrobacterium tumefaciens]
MDAHLLAGCDRQRVPDGLIAFTDALIVALEDPGAKRTVSCRMSSATAGMADSMATTKIRDFTIFMEGSSWSAACATVSSGRRTLTALLGFL